MDPRWLFPLLAAGFALAALWRSLQGGPGGRLMARTWWWLALAFAAVSAWLHLMAGPR